ncbi:unnamed protein product [Rotaria socialis]|uniref:Uncharacterized protein n=1 Tax=Rotaria socialis TaxID=392032 RepID=A0A818VNA1_9BILA|nr:unnamed protein product [Rotaria socialis]CAF3479854.1 unnamed protein product [Rotaria socialis]CAF3490574.1 unnamed protein product [Rotaria socialis]CAF3675898.1 unnamed protein product [Rotaria socialis]CAF3712654.1 unnamed protein product [Rotaria socialis]
MENDCEAKVTPSTQPYDTLSESPSTKTKTNLQNTEAIVCNARTIFYACPFVLLALLILLGIPLLQIIIGSLCKNECPVNPLIPVYLLVMGVATLTLISTVILAVTVKKLSFLFYLSILLALLMFGWCITGTVWIFKSQGKAQFYYPNQRSTYCQYSVFNGARVLSYMNYFYLTGLLSLFSKRSNQ